MAPRKSRVRTPRHESSTSLAKAPPESSHQAGSEPARADTSLVPSDPLQRYLAEIRRFSLLTPEEEYELAVAWRRDQDRSAAYRLATGNLRLVVHIAMDFRRATLSLMDLIQEGNIGLMQAIQRFDPFRGIRFSAYASWWIRAYMLKYIIDHWSLVRVGTTNARKKLFFNLKREKQRLEALGIAPATRLLAEQMGVSESDVVDVQRAVEGRDVSIDTPLRANPDSTLHDVLHASQPLPDEQVAEKEYRELVSNKLQEFGARLKGKEQEVFRRRLLAEEPATLQEIGDAHGVTREAIRQIEKRVIDKLRRFLSRELAEFRGVQVSSGPA